MNETAKICSRIGAWESLVTPEGSLESKIDRKRRDWESERIEINMYGERRELKYIEEKKGNDGERAQGRKRAGVNVVKYHLELAE